MSEREQEGTVESSVVLRAMVGLCRGLGIDSTEQEMVSHFAAVVEPLLPGCRLAIQTVQLITGQIIGVSPPELEAVDPGAWRSGVSLFAGMHHREVVVLDGEGPLGQVIVESMHPIPMQTMQIAETMSSVLAMTVRSRRLSRDARFLRKWLASTIDNANALIFVVDPGLNFTLCNRALVELLGCTPEEALEHDVLRWVVQEEHEFLRQQVRAALDGRKIAGCELTLACHNGEMVPTIFNMARPADAVESVVAIGQDVTPVKRLEHQVIQAEKLASLGQLAAGVVHEINNPLTSITVYADYLAKKFRRAGYEEDGAMLEKILEGSNRIFKFSRDLVDYGKPSGSQMDVLSLNEVVQQAVSFCEHVLDRAGARLTLTLAQGLPPLYGVKDQLQQVLINLLTNACHALAPTGGALRVTTRPEGSTHVAVEVSDGGCGIRGGDLPQIFEPFFTTKTPGEGTGLGLSIVKKIVDSHNGTIMVRSTEGQGTTFCITLPTGHG